MLSFLFCLLNVSRGELAPTQASVSVDSHPLDVFHGGFQIGNVLIWHIGNTPRQCARHHRFNTPQTGILGYSIVINLG
jgi:hypothetical protein